MGAMLVGILLGAPLTIIGILYIITVYLLLAWAPGVIARFLIKKRQLTLPERKKFRRIFALIFGIPILIDAAGQIISIFTGSLSLLEALTDIILLPIPLLILLATNSVILKIPDRGRNRNP